MCKSEIEYLRKLQKHAGDTRVFLSNQKKPERERSVCRAFLRAIGISYKEQELLAPTEEPVDVAFRTARFQIMEILEPHRRRGDDWKRKERKYSEACSLADVTELHFPQTSVTLEELMPTIVLDLSRKAQKYGRECKKIDALAYVNRRDQFLKADSDIPNLDKLREQGWRSVSILFPPYGVILFVTPEASDFLVALAPGQYRCCSDIDSFFKPGQ